jgi:hypothetical protein
MAAGRFDSSLTRVQPVMNQLYRRNSTGRGWLSALHALGSRSGETHLPAADEWTGTLTRRREFEFGVHSSTDYLDCLVRTPGRTHWPSDKGKPREFSEATTRNRRALLRGDDAALQDAVRGLAVSRRPGPWWVSEGTTMVDCALFADGVTVFIEGKRTEPSLTGGVEWDPKRDQICPNLDCLRALEGRAGRYLVLLILEQGAPPLRAGRRIRLRLRRREGVVAPPRRAGGQAALGRYLGYTTWQRVCERFGEWPILLPATADDAFRAGLVLREARPSAGPRDRPALP